MTTAFLYITLSTAAYYLASRAKITSWIWSRYPGWLDYWTLCAACFGTAAGAGAAAALGWPLDLSLLGLPGRTWYTPLVAGALGMVWTPILAYLQVSSWSALMPDEGDATPDDPRPDAPTIPLRRPPDAA